MKYRFKEITSTNILEKKEIWVSRRSKQDKKERRELIDLIMFYSSLKSQEGYIYDISFYEDVFLRRGIFFNVSFTMWE